MIREAYYTDIERIMHIWLTASEKAHDFITKEYWAEKYGDVKDNYIPYAKSYVYIENDAILGFVSIVDNKYLGAIFIDVNHQKRGIGKTLTDFVKDKYPVLSLKVYQKNTDAVQFYKKQGFKVIKTSTDKNTGEKELVMQWKKTII